MPRRMDCPAHRDNTVPPGSVKALEAYRHAGNGAAAPLDRGKDLGDFAGKSLWRSWPHSSIAARRSQLVVVETGHTKSAT